MLQYNLLSVSHMWHLTIMLQYVMLIMYVCVLQSYVLSQCSEHLTYYVAVCNNGSVYYSSNNTIIGYNFGTIVYRSLIFMYFNVVKSVQLCVLHLSICVLQYNLLSVSHLPYYVSACNNSSVYAAQTMQSKGAIF